MATDEVESCLAMQTMAVDTSTEQPERPLHRFDVRSRAELGRSWRDGSRSSFDPMGLVGVASASFSVWNNLTMPRAIDSFVTYLPQPTMDPTVWFTLYYQQLATKIAAAVAVDAGLITADLALKKYTFGTELGKTREPLRIKVVDSIMSQVLSHYSDDLNNQQPATPVAVASYTEGFVASEGSYLDISRALGDPHCTRKSDGYQGSQSFEYRFFNSPLTSSQGFYSPAQLVGGRVEYLVMRAGSMQVQQGRSLGAELATGPITLVVEVKSVQKLDAPNSAKWLVNGDAQVTMELIAALQQNRNNFPNSYVPAVYAALTDGRYWKFYAMSLSATLNTAFTGASVTWPIANSAGDSYTCMYRNYQVTRLSVWLDFQNANDQTVILQTLHYAASSNYYYPLLSTTAYPAPY